MSDQRPFGQLSSPVSLQPLPTQAFLSKFDFRREFEVITDGLSDALEFSRTIGADPTPPFERGGGKGTFGEVDFYTRYA